MKLEKICEYLNEIDRQNVINEIKQQKIKSLLSQKALGLVIAL